MEKIIDNQKLAVSQLHSIGSKLSNDFKKLGIENIDDLLWFFPWRYQDLSQIKTIAELNENETTTLKVKIEKINSYRSWRKKILITEAKISDETGTAQALWFNQKFIAKY